MARLQMYAKGLMLTWEELYEPYKMRLSPDRAWPYQCAVCDEAVVLRFAAGLSSQPECIVAAQLVCSDGSRYRLGFRASAHEDGYMPFDLKLQVGFVLFHL